MIKFLKLLFFTVIGAVALVVFCALSVLAIPAGIGALVIYWDDIKKWIRKQAA